MLQQLADAQGVPPVKTFTSDVSGFVQVNIKYPLETPDEREHRCLSFVKRAHQQAGLGSSRPAKIARRTVNR